MRTDGGSLISLRGVAYAYDRELVLTGIDMDIERGSMVGIVGPSGSGKTTLLKLLAGALDPSRGSVSRDRDVRVGYVPQVESVNWYFPVTVDEVVLMGSPSRRFGAGYTADERQRAHSLLHDLGIGHLENRHIRELSGGQQQRVFLARALMADPHVVLLDEPMSGVDVKTRQDVLAALRQLAAGGVAVVLTTHDLNSVAAHLPQVVCMNRRIVARGTPLEVLVPDVLFTTFGARMELIEHHGHPIVIDMHAEPVAAAAEGSVDGSLA